MVILNYTSQKSPVIQNIACRSNGIDVLLMKIRFSRCCSFVRSASVLYLFIMSFTFPFFFQKCQWISKIAFLYTSRGSFLEKIWIYASVVCVKSVLLWVENCGMLVNSGSNHTDVLTSAVIESNICGKFLARDHKGWCY